MARIGQKSGLLQVADQIMDPAAYTVQRAARHHLAVVEDCAHAHGAQWHGRGAGTLGQFGSFSLQSSKIMTTGEGGACCGMTEFQAALGIVACERFPEQARQREQMIAYLDESLFRGGLQLVDEVTAALRKLQANREALAGLQRELEGRR